MNREGALKLLSKWYNLGVFVRADREEDQEGDHEKKFHDNHKIYRFASICDLCARLTHPHTSFPLI